MTPNILIVDDRPENLLALEQLLNTFGAHVLKARSGTEALELLLEHEVALALVDVQMPEMDGYELATLMRGSERTRGVPIIFVTADGADYGRVFRGYDVGAVDFLVKPIEPRWLENKVRTFLRLHKQATELRAAERRLQSMLESVRASERRFRALADTMPQLAWTADEDGEVDYFNSRLCEYAPVERLPDGRWNWASIAHPDDREETARAWQRARARGKEYAQEQRLRMADGSHRWHLSRARLERGPGGAADKWFGTATDIHDRKRSELELEQNQARLAQALAAAERAIDARDQVVSIVSHDLRNPLGVLRTAIYLLRDTFQRRAASGPGVDVASYLQRMDRQVTTMDKLLDELLDVAKLQAGQPLTLERSSVDLVELARELTREHARSARSHTIELRASETTLRGDWDPRRLGQVIDNLLANAIKYSPQGSTILVEVDFVWAGPCESAVLRVIDEGVGIPADEHERVFEWFARARNVEGRIRGTGVGLAGAKQIVEQHGGSIHVESEEGVGSTFTVRLPTRADRADGRSRSTSPGTSQMSA